MGMPEVVAACRISDTVLPPYAFRAVLPRAVALLRMTTEKVGASAPGSASLGSLYRAL